MCVGVGGCESRSDLNLLLHLPVCICIHSPIHLLVRFCAGALKRGFCKACLQNLCASRASRTPRMPRGRTERRGRSSAKDGEVVRTRDLLSRVRGRRRRRGRRQPVSAHATRRMVWFRGVIRLQYPKHQFRSNFECKGNIQDSSLRIAHQCSQLAVFERHH